YYILVILYLNLLIFDDLYSEGNNFFLNINKLRLEYIDSPINVSVVHPRFSWVLESNERGQKQTAYQIQVSNNITSNNNMWDSGKIISSETSQIYYEGKNLKSNTQYFWRVQIWDKDHLIYESELTNFWTAILDSTLWQADWIGAGLQEEYFPEQGFFQNVKEQYKLSDTVNHEGQSLLLRNEFICSDSIKNARVFVTGVGFYELYLNGNRIGEHLLAPAKTNYRKEILYDTYDVTEVLNEGNNAVGIHLGNGWFNPYKKWWRPYRMQWFGAKRAYFQLHVEYQNGRKEIITSNNKWKEALGPVLYNCIYDGEVYDANKEINNWTSVNFNNSSWTNVNIVESPGGKLTSQTMPSIKITQTLNPVMKTEPAQNTVVYDMGQNFTGWVRITVNGEKGSKLQLQFAEDIMEDGSINTTSNEHAKANVLYILKGGGSETYEPRFTYFGFRYVEVTCSGKMPSIENILGLVVNTAVQNTGEFNCGNETINKIHRATVWSQRSNMVGYPMDCPQRDERLGWFGDVQVTIDEAMFNFNMPQFYMNWLSGIKSNQNKINGDIPIISPRPYIWDEGVEWSSTYIILVWKFYKYFGDKKILLEHYSSIKRYMEFLNSISNNYIIKKGWIGDWGSLVEDWKEGEPESIPTAYYYWNSEILSKIANVLGKNEDELFFLKLSKSVRNEYNKKFYNPEKKIYNDGSQMANAFPLYLGLVPENDKKFVLKNLVNDIVINNKGHLTTGVLGSKYMIDVLSREGRQDIAYLLATQTGYPSWSDMVEKYTTMCEFWTLKQSHNHVMTGSIDAFFFNTLAGINIEEDHPGCKQIVIKPYTPENLTYVNASVETINGKVNSSWKRTNKGLVYNITIPTNVTAEIELQSTSSSRIFEGKKIAEFSKGVKLTESGLQSSKYFVESGEYEFLVQ
ncbi:MAG: family 78 glycoside hydrolase catalytic domain, partial [Ignavibacteriae bacterium]|nr:family 78 glycoside hydrolase catalytic domain [Ignavibacteriota bacterium]